MKMRFFTDRFKDQNLTQKPIYISWYHENQAINYPIGPDSKRVWIEVDVPEDSQLWPNFFMGTSATVISTEVQEK